MPVYNEERTLLEIMKRVIKVDVDKEIIAVDDGSCDSSPDILRQLEGGDLRVYLRGENEGKASAVRYGIGKSRGEYILIQDADLEYDPRDYPRLIKKIEITRAGAVYGSRFEKGSKNMFFRQKAANRILTFLTNLLYSGKVGDMETCYKLIRADILREIPLREEGFDIEAELTAKLLRRKVKIENEPIRYSGRSYEEGKKIGFSDALRAVYILFKYRFDRRGNLLAGKKI